MLWEQPSTASPPACIIPDDKKQQVLPRQMVSEQLGRAGAQVELARRVRISCSFRTSMCKRRAPVPIFEYVCNQCNRSFEALVFGKDKPSCPSCQGKDLAMQLSVFSVPAKAQSAPESVGACGSCGDPRGPGSCSLPDLD